MKGAVDDLDLVLKTLEKVGYTEDRFYIHVDGALFGLMMPFVRRVSLLHSYCQAHYILTVFVHHFNRMIRVPWYCPNGVMFRACRRRK